MEPQENRGSIRSSSLTRPSGAQKSKSPSQNLDQETNVNLRSNRLGSEKILTGSIYRLPPNFVAKIRAAKEFFGRLKEIETRMLAEHPLLKNAQEIKWHVENEWTNLKGSKDDQIIREWSAKDPQNKIQSRARATILKLESYIEMLDDQELAPLIEDGLSGGWLSNDMSKLFQWELEKEGISAGDIPLIETEIRDRSEYKAAMMQFYEEVRSKEANRFAFEQIPDNIELALQRRARNRSMAYTIDYYQRSILTEEIISEYGKHYQALKSIKEAPFIQPTPPEVNELLTAFEQSGIIDPSSR